MEKFIRSEDCQGGSVPDPGSGAFLTPAGSQTHINDRIMKIFRVKSAIILTVVFRLKKISVKKLNYFQFYDTCGYKTGRTKKTSPPPLFWCCCWIQDLGSGID